MDVQIKITADDKALEFSRNLSNFYANLVVSGFVADENKETIAKVDKTADVKEEKDEQDRPWETIEPDPIKVDEESKEEASKAKYTVEQIRELGSQYMNAHGAVAFKALLGKYGIKKLVQLPEEKYGQFAEDVQNAG